MGSVDTIIPRSAVVRFAGVNNIRAIAATDEVTALTASDAVIALAAAECVIGCAAFEGVIASVPIEYIAIGLVACKKLALARYQQVVASPTIEGVGVRTCPLKSTLDGVVASIAMEQIAKI